jgi:hypothetical protein
MPLSKNIPDENSQKKMAFLIENLSETLLIQRFHKFIRFLHNHTCDDFYFQAGKKLL